MTPIPTLEQFRLEVATNGIAHLIFDCPGRTMNVLSDAAIDEIGAVADWLENADIVGLLIRSGKDNAFCAGADLGELGIAYDRIMAARPQRRFDAAFDHFFRLSHALRRIETAGKPVVAAIAGLALGGGCELALAAHGRVLVDDPRVAIGLPESLVGLLPGAGGTQRLPRLIGIDAALPILLDGARLAGVAARDAGLVDRLCAPGEEIATAEAWLLAGPDALQPWDHDGWVAPSTRAVSASIAPVRDRTLAATLGHYPAPLAILDCVEHGLAQDFEGAIRTEMAIFAHLIQREEPRNMIQTLFLAKTDHDRQMRRGALPYAIADVVATTHQFLTRHGANPALHATGFPPGDAPAAMPVRHRAAPGYWIDGDDERAAEARNLLAILSRSLASFSAGLGEAELRLIDYAVVAAAGYPAYLGGPFAYAARNG